MSRVVYRNSARRDLLENFVFLGENAGEEVARRFLRSVESTLQQLARMPHMGVTRKFRNSKFTGVRMWRVEAFEKHLIFYRPLKDGILVLRLIHGARDIEKLFRG